MTRKIITFLGILMFLGFIGFELTKSTKVIDGDTGMPVSNAVVMYQYSNLADYCGNPTVKETSHNGVVIRPLRLGVCAIAAIAPGYHYNGYNHISRVPKQIILYRQMFNNVPTRFDRVFTQGEGMDVLAYLNTVSARSEMNEVTKSGTRDFMMLSSDTITFFGNGGIQQIKEEPDLLLGEFNFGMENLRTAPDTGYVKELKLLSKGSYIARLRDGRHFVKFYVEAGKGNICMNFFANEKEGNALDFLDIGTNIDCSYNRNYPMCPIEESLNDTQTVCVPAKDRIFTE